MQKPLLIDLDGVLRVKNRPADGIEEFLKFIKESEINSCILSNSSISTSKQIRTFFERHLINIEIPIITAIDAAKIYVRKKYKKVAVFTSENVIDQFADYLEYEKPNAVLIGDIGDNWNYKLVQQIFEYVRAGAELIAIHKNKFWDHPENGIQLDAGPFIHAIEYATSTKATLIGKPTELYFRSALEKINSKFENSFVMLGDDLDTDISGANKLGADTILIYTGKTCKPINDKYKNLINYEAMNLVDVIEIIKTRI